MFRTKFAPGVNRPVFHFSSIVTIKRHIRLKPSQNHPEDELPKKKSRSYKRPSIQWEPVLHFVKGDEATHDEDEMKLQIRPLDDAKLPTK